MNFTVGDKYHVAYWVKPDVYSCFQQCSNDFNPLHTDDEYARQKGFKERVMYGNILNVFISNFIGECLPEKNVIIHSQQIGYKNPVYLNDQLDFEAQVSGVFESVKAVEFKFRFIKNDGLIAAKGTIQIGWL